MFLRTAATTIGMTMAGAVFTAGVGVGMAAVGAACLARRAMKQRRGWRDEPDTLSAAEATPDEGQPIPGANPI